MKSNDMRLQNILSNGFIADRERDLTAYSLEGFGEAVDNRIENELLRSLILDHAVVADRLEVLNKELELNLKLLSEAQNIAMLGCWDSYGDLDKLVWSNSMYDILELDYSVRPTLRLYLSMVHPDDLDAVTLSHSKLYEINEPWNTRYRLLMKGGRIKWVHLRLSPTVDNKGHIIHYHGTLQDITEMKKTEDKLQKHSLHLEEMVEEKVREITAAQMATIYALIKLSESRDDDTGAHIERTASFCRLLAEQARGLSKYSDEIDDNFIETIYKASPLHDIGKVGIPDRILLKPGKLTDDEATIMMTHVQIGYQTLEKAGQQYDRNEFLKMGLDIALYHHEKWNGSGYQKGISGDKIPLSARIMAISDVYDALRSKRVYKDAFSHEKSTDIIIASKGSHFDPGLVDVYVREQDRFKMLFDSL